MDFVKTRQAVFNRGVPNRQFLEELVMWGRAADPAIFAPNDRYDIYNKIKPELGPWEDPIARRAAMLEVLRVLAGFESSWDWMEGSDTSRESEDTDENDEAGAWQVSYDSRKLSTKLSAMLIDAGIHNGIDFQRVMKHDHTFAMDYVATLLRWNTKHNGPLYKGDERLAIRRSLRGAEHSIYPWLSKASMTEFEHLL